jgi:hypothetical protein
MIFRRYHSFVKREHAERYRKINDNPQEIYYFVKHSLFEVTCALIPRTLSGGAGGIVSL